MFILPTINRFILELAQWCSTYGPQSHVIQSVTTGLMVGYSGGWDSTSRIDCHLHAVKFPELHSGQVAWLCVADHIGIWGWAWCMRLNSQTDTYAIQLAHGARILGTSRLAHYLY